MGYLVGHDRLSVDIDGPHGLRWQMSQYIERKLIPKPPDLGRAVDNTFADTAHKGK